MARIQRFIVIAIGASIAVSVWLRLSRATSSVVSRNRFFGTVPRPNAKVAHPIDTLIREAEAAHKHLLAEQSSDVASAAQRYRARRGRHPPPGFDAWFEYARERDAVIVEAFFDRIYKDVAPFWAQDPRLTAQRSAQWHHVVKVRKGTATAQGNVEGMVPWLQLWTSLTEEAAPYLPDVDMPVNLLDESRLLVPWEKIAGYMEEEQASRARSIFSKEHALTNMSGLGVVDADVKSSGGKPYDPEWTREGSYWELARAACAPNEPSRDVAAPSDYSHPPIMPKDWEADYMYHGYVRNFSAGRNPCVQPHVREMHGTFVEPITMSSTKELIPLFGGSKLPINNEVLIPGAMYLTDDPFYSGGASHGPRWKSKIDGVVWRGVASGGRNKRENWTHMQRHRLVQMMNGTTVSRMEKTKTRGATFDMPPTAKYKLSQRSDGGVGDWLKGFANIGFVNLLCFPAESHCDYVAPHFSTVPAMPMAEQYRYKFMLDVDGNSFSARFRGLMLSTSLPIKSTIYAEWHDDRLTPWLHFVPMDNTYQDLYAILDYFTRDADGDTAARLLAEQGQQWSMKVLRRDDMLLYVWRLLLEWARVCDPERERLGYVDDMADDVTDDGGR